MKFIDKTPKSLSSTNIKSLLISFAVPAVIAQVAMSLYNVADRAFIGQGVDALALSGLAITLPFVNLSVALGAMVGVGLSTLVSIKLGEKKIEDARRLLANSLVLNIIVGVLYGAVMLIFLDKALLLFGATENTIGYAREYMRVILWSNVVTHLYFGYNFTLRAIGLPKKAMYSMITSVVLNIFLDYMFIMVFHWGISGAAYATVISQFICFVWELMQISDKKLEVRIMRGYFRLDMKLVRKGLGIGLSPCLMNSAACLVNLFINMSLIKYGGDLSVAAFGIANSLILVFVMIVLGISQGMQPIAGYNYGAHRGWCVTVVYRLSVIAATVVTCLAFVLSQTVPALVARMFTTDPALIDLSARAMRIMMMFFPVVGFIIISTSLFQSIGKPSISILLSLCRQVFFVIPTVILLPKAIGLDGVWWGLPVADIAALILTIPFLVHLLKSLKNMQSQDSMSV